ncbi:MAG: 50S ribosomal protein L25/general stress protein Ctc [Bdellovibrionales bacterium]
MANTYQLAAQTRDRAGKGIARALRREDKVPAVVYGDNKEPILISISSRDVEVEYHKAHMFTTLCDMEIGKDKAMVLARDIQLDPVTDKVVHVDFLRVTKKTKIAVQVPVVFTNQEECEGLQRKGVLNVVRHDVELMCSATHIPESVEVDMTGFVIGDSIKMSNVKLPDDAFSTADRDITIATIAAPRVEAEPTEEGEEAAEGEEASEEAGEEASEGDAE